MRGKPSRPVINNDAFRDSIERSSLLSAYFVDVSQSVQLYNSDLSRILKNEGGSF